MALPCEQWTAVSDNRIQFLRANRFGGFRQEFAAALDVRRAVVEVAAICQVQLLQHGWAR